MGGGGVAAGFYTSPLILSAFYMYLGRNMRRRRIKKKKLATLNYRNVALFLGAA